LSLKLKKTWNKLLVASVIIFGNSEELRFKEAAIKGRTLKPYMQKVGDSWDISPQFFLDFPQNFRLRTRNQYCTQAIA